MADLKKREVFLVYDGACPLCTFASRYLRIRKAVGKLTLIDARTDTTHPLIQEINTNGINLDEGMVIKFENTLYHGKDALHVMGLLSTDHDWFNRLNALLFRSKYFSNLCYPFLRLMRRLALIIKGKSLIKNIK